MKKLLTLSLAIALLVFTSLPVAAEENRDTHLLALAADALAPNGSYALRLSICAMLINRQKSESYPKSLAAVICDAGISLSCTQNATARSLRAAADALSGSDPTCGALNVRRERDEKERPHIVIEGYYFY